jgi:hypothetical protein
VVLADFVDPTPFGEALDPLLDGVVLLFDFDMMYLRDIVLIEILFFSYKLVSVIAFLLLSFSKLPLCPTARTEPDEY